MCKECKQNSDTNRFHDQFLYREANTQSLQHQLAPGTENHQCRTGLKRSSRFLLCAEWDHHCLREELGWLGRCGGMERKTNYVLYLVTMWTRSGVKLVFAWRMTTKMGLLSDKGKGDTSDTHESLKITQKQIPEQVAIQSDGNTDFQHSKKC